MGVCSRNNSSSSNSNSSIAGGDDGGLARVRFMNVKLRCELCKEAAILYCPADEARLCWDCDARIHSANFLVARHSRALLCSCCGALASDAPLRHAAAIRLHNFCQSCREAAAQTYGRLHSDQESKVVCSSDESCCSDDDDDDEDESLSLSRLRELIRPALNQVTQHALWIEGAGDSEEDDYCHLLSSSHCN